MRLGPWVLMRMHPAEKELRKVHQLTPALRELVARMARAAAKDAVQDVLEQQGQAWKTQDLGTASVPWKHHRCWDTDCPLGDNIPYAPADMAHAHPFKRDKHNCAEDDPR